MFINRSFVFNSGKVLPIFFLLFLPMFVLAQQNPTESLLPPADAPVAQGIEIASINLTNAAVLSQDKESLVLEFTLENHGSNPQFDIKYGVELIKELENGAQEVADSFVGRETLTVPGGQRISKVINYGIAGVPPGTYSIWITARTTGGTLLGLGTAGQMTVIAADVVEIKVETCYLTIDEDVTPYTLGQGVDVSAGEDLILNCVLKNHSSETREVLPQFDTFLRTMFGEKTAVEYEIFAPISIEAGAEEELRLSLPKATEPQAYDVVVTLADTDSQSVVSNRATAHYVIQGVSATIQTLNFSKKSYNAGENIELNFTWTDSADGFVGSRQEMPVSELQGGTLGTNIPGGVSAQVVIKDGNGQLCTSEVTQLLAGSLVSISAVADRDCFYPEATISLQGPGGTVLDSRTIIGSMEAGLPETGVVPVKNSMNALMMITLVAFGISLIIVLLALSRRKRTDAVS